MSMVMVTIVRPLTYTLGHKNSLTTQCYIEGTTMHRAHGYSYYSKTTDIHTRPLKIHL